MKFLTKVLPPDISCDVAVQQPEEMSVKELKLAIAQGGLGKQALGLSEKFELIKLVKDNMPNRQ